MGPEDGGETLASRRTLSPLIPLRALFVYSATGTSFDLDPIVGTPPAIGSACSLRDDPLEAHALRSFK